MHIFFNATRNTLHVITEHYTILLVRNTGHYATLKATTHMTSKVVLPAISRAVVVPASDNPGDGDDGNEPGAASEFLLTLQQSKKEVLCDVATYIPI